MQVQIIAVGDGDADALAELNRFLRANRVLTVQQHRGEGSWSFCITYQQGAEPSAQHKEPGGGKIDYKEVLDAPTFALFSKLRDWRKEVAETEKLPVYAVFTNEQLAEMARQKPTSNATLGAISGVGESKVNHYASAVLKIISEHESKPSNSGTGDKSGQPA
jgi:superfamily II DNA helicase RecQ